MLDLVGVVGAEPAVTEIDLAGLAVARARPISVVVIGAPSGFTICVEERGLEAAGVERVDASRFSVESELADAELLLVAVQAGRRVSTLVRGS